MRNFLRRSVSLLQDVTHKGFFHLLSVNFLSQFLSFGSSLLVVKFLTPVELGEIKILQSYAGLFIVFGGLGINSAILKYCSENTTDETKNGILRSGLVWNGASTLLTLLLVAGLALSGVITSSRHLAVWLLVFSLSIPFATVTNVLMAFLQATKRIREMAQAQGWIKIQSFVVIILSTWLWGFKGFIFANIAAYILGLIPLLTQVGPSSLKAPAQSLSRGFLNIALFSVLSNGVNILGQQGDLFILDHLATDRVAIGYYSLATIFILAARQITSTVQSITTPYFSARAQEQDWFWKRLFSTQLQTGLISIGISVATYCGAWLLIHFFYGAEYQPALGYLAILLLRYVLWSSCAVLGVALFALELIHYNLIASLLSTLVGLGCSVLLLGQMNILGVAWAQVVGGLTLFVSTAFFTWVAWRRRPQVLAAEG